MTKLRADARRNRERLLEVAQAAFASEGLSVQIDEIASRAGVGVGTVYRHFPTKEALFEAVVSSHKQRLIEKSASLLDHENPGEALFGFIHHMVEASVMNKALADDLASSGVKFDCTDPDAKQELYDAINKLLSRAQQAGAVRSDIGVAELLALLSGILLAKTQYAGESGVLRRMTEIVCDGLRGGGSRK
ncbi:hypothetical protein SD70_02000 [Gordoniibacillus kamchatkensis]|uniref:HTH tetR-type domain-containing protein n=1 Tax=Gordoniibacillus kamchatkensis TaxID=1590651 RepID=A0ABR5AP46_9BACL|nr:TetR/AcrR family transcriptional regulator [Paenibacillus sp. VKM B-2647]KIL42310.1 hypothetical protein SD70_02000 [Paenibacillus sp. VKM B-2647]